MIRSLTKMVHWISDDSFDQWSHLMVIVSTGVIWWSLCPMESSDGHCVQWSHLIVIVSNGVIWWSLCPMMKGLDLKSGGHESGQLLYDCFWGHFLYICHTLFTFGAFLYDYFCEQKKQLCILLCLFTIISFVLFYFIYIHIFEHLYFELCF